MQKKKRKDKSFYIDTNIALDYATNRNVETLLVLEKIREKKWKCVSSIFLSMEMADYKKDAVFVADKALNEKWEMRKILRNSYDKRLTTSDFEKIMDWFEDFKKRYKNITLYDFLQDKEGWNTAQEISFYSNLSAADAIHLTSAIMGTISGFCDVLVTNDKLLGSEAKRIIEQYRLKNKLKVMTIAEVKKDFFKK